MNICEFIISDLSGVFDKPNDQQPTVVYTTHNTVNLNSSLDKDTIKPLDNESLSSQENIQTLEMSKVKN